MSEQSFSMLLVGPGEATERQLSAAFADGPVSIARAHTAAEAFAELERVPADVVLLESAQGGDSSELLRGIQEHWPGLPILLLTAHSSQAEVACAVALGASDLLTQPITEQQLGFAIRKALAAVRRSAAAPPPPMPPSPTDGVTFFGRSPAMQAVRALLAQVAPSSSTVLVRGESGTGKELIARSLHRASPRAKAPLVKIDCTSLPENLIESELFGYEKGAFTGAHGAKPGRVELAHTGTLFLDEVGELPLTTQAKLLRLLQDREIERLGGTKTIQVDVRVVAATHRDLEAMVQQGAFREDLFYRLNVLPIWLAPLRARRADIEDLARHFCADAGAKNGKSNVELSAGAMRTLVAQRWPGNVRQLQNFVERLIVLSTGTEISEAEVQAELGRPVRFATETGAAGADAGPSERDSTQSGPTLPLSQALHIAERAALTRALKHAAGNRSAAARLLGVSRTTLYAKLQEYGLL